MNKLIILLYRATTYFFLKIKYPELKKLKFNGFGIYFFGEGEVYCGRNSYVSYMSRFFIDKDTTFTIGSNTSLGHNLRVYTSKADSRILIETGIKKIIKGNVVIGNNVLIGSNVYIGPNVDICDNVIIGANSVVTKSIIESGVYSGINAEKIN